ncbi:MAG: hypothetical protein E7058_06805 [Lentisphaerae bacterium]|nr:hypothetical protein [Lentisphaerota bacterium]
MKKFGLIWGAILICYAAAAEDFDKDGVISGWKFAPVQTGLGLDGYKELFDTDSTALLATGLLGVKQRAAIISLGAFSKLGSNYGIQTFFIGGAKRNYGLMVGFENISSYGDNYGVKIGTINISGKFKQVQLAGIDFFEILHVGIANYNAPVQIGAVNLNDKNALQIGVFNITGNQSPGIGFQLGLLNYNPGALIPLMPLFNFSLGDSADRKQLPEDADGVVIPL